MKLDRIKNLLYITILYMNHLLSLVYVINSWTSVFRIWVIILGKYLGRQPKVVYPNISQNYYPYPENWSPGPPRPTRSMGYAHRPWQAHKVNKVRRVFIAHIVNKVHARVTSSVCLHFVSYKSCKLLVTRGRF